MVFSFFIQILKILKKGLYSVENFFSLGLGAFNNHKQTISNWKTLIILHVITLFSKEHVKLSYDGQTSYSVEYQTSLSEPKANSEERKQWLIYGAGRSKFLSPDIKIMFRCLEIGLIHNKNVYTIFFHLSPPPTQNSGEVVWPSPELWALHAPSLQVAGRGWS